MKDDLCIRECLEIIFNRMRDGEVFGGLELKRWVVQLNSKYRDTFPDTILREVRRFHRDEFVKYKPRQSLYKVTKPKE